MKGRIGNARLPVLDPLPVAVDFPLEEFRFTDLCNKGLCDSIAQHEDTSPRLPPCKLSRAQFAYGYGIFGMPAVSCDKPKKGRIRLGKAQGKKICCICPLKKSRGGKEGLNVARGQVAVQPVAELLAV